ncbi:branched-chain amino acid ABC transporter permease [Oceanibium sediminis]|uniref:branched-chain amino acid ABC transporter permease n=1 Tax=Oceanibium sediminis TaxID=2026339 RepID=UPI000DD4E646|nr:branched-chain amino acid ABC transporter permease [Oceanibium sediminis]
MFYREAGDFKTSYAADGQTFPIAFDRWRYMIVVAIGFLAIPLFITEYMANAVLIPFLIWSVIAIGLNILTGYCGQVSLGTGGFMAVGAYACYKFMTGLDVWYVSACEGGANLFFLCTGVATYSVLFELPEFNIAFSVLMGGLTTAAVGLLFGLPSLRIKGFYLAVATLAAQFFLVWLFNKWSWAYNYSASGQINAPTRELLGFEITGPTATAEVKYLFCLTILFLMAWLARNLTRGRLGRSWMAIRDMDIAAEIIGVNPLKAKLSAFAVSSFFVGVGGALFFSVYLGAVEVGEAFGIQKSFLALFMIIIGGLGSIFGSFAGAAFIVLMPVLLKNIMVGGFGWPTDIAAHFEFIILGGLIIFFLIVEPHGLAALWRTLKEKLRLWPFPH